MIGFLQELASAAGIFKPCREDEDIFDFFMPFLIWWRSFGLDYHEWLTPMHDFRIILKDYNFKQLVR